MKNNDEQIAVFLNGDSSSELEIYVDDLLMRPADVDVYQVIDAAKTILKNTLCISKK